MVSPVDSSSSSYYNQYLENQGVSHSQIIEQETRQLDQAFLSPYQDAVNKTHQQDQSILNGN